MKALSVVVEELQKNRPELVQSNDCPICEDEPYPKYAPGLYDVRCTNIKQYLDKRFKRRVCLLECRELLTNNPVVAFLNMGNKEKPTVGRGSKYRRVWILATGRQPNKRERMDAREFIGKIFTVRIDVTKKQHDGLEHPEAAQYSTITDFIKRLYP